MPVPPDNFSKLTVPSERAIRRGEVLSEQLQAALNSRVIIEQAKGVLAQRGNLSMHAAFDRLRRYARNHNVRLSEVAREVVETDLTADDVLSAPDEHSHSASIVALD
jgi:AmiR/NasT family two-component response regulator